MRGRAHVFGDEINTDVIAPGTFYGASLEERVSHLFEPIRPGFAAAVDRGDLVVAGKHFGSGSSRETAPETIQAAGIAAVVAASFSRTFYRNSIAIGLPVIASPTIVAATTAGDVLEIAFEENTIHNRSSGVSDKFDALPPQIRDVFDSEGLIEYYRANPKGMRTD